MDLEEAADIYRPDLTVAFPCVCSVTDIQRQQSESKITEWDTQEEKEESEDVFRKT